MLLDAFAERDWGSRETFQLRRRRSEAGLPGFPFRSRCGTLTKMDVGRPCNTQMVDVDKLWRWLFINQCYTRGVTDTVLVGSQWNRWTDRASHMVLQEDGPGKSMSKSKWLWYILFWGCVVIWSVVIYCQHHSHLLQQLRWVVAKSCITQRMVEGLADFSYLAARLRPQSRGKP